jgi:hypothetical protein
MTASSSGNAAGAAIQPFGQWRTAFGYAMLTAT